MSKEIPRTAPTSSYGLPAMGEYKWPQGAQLPRLNLCDERRWRLETLFDNLDSSNIHIQKRLEEVQEELREGLRTAEPPKKATRAKRPRTSGAD
ncbi:hypothetical protein BJX96DRAFT_180434 [Aspergillus floccosus]